jgi:hypothetical protein
MRGSIRAFCSMRPQRQFGTPGELASAWADVCPCAAIAGSRAACDPAVLGALGVRRVLKLYDGSVGYEYQEGVQYHEVGLRDSADFDARPHLAPCLRFIRDGARRGEKTLVHCQMGVSRSAAVVTLHLMVVHEMTLADAAARLRAAHPQSSPNAGLIATLQAIDAQLRARRSETERIS